MENGLDRCGYCNKHVYHAPEVVDIDGLKYCAACYEMGPVPYPPEVYEPHIQWRERRAVNRAMAEIAEKYLEKHGNHT